MVKLVHEVLTIAESKTRNKFVRYALHGWQAINTVTDMRVTPTPVQDAQTVICKLTETMGPITATFEQTMGPGGGSLKISVDGTSLASDSGFTSWCSVPLAEPYSLDRIAQWLKDALEFAFRGVNLPTNSV